ncbi:CaiB/BaiF CoA transferase family protein [Chloroflexota bacterium]
MSGPLDGVRVLDMGAFSVGPTACSLMGLLGAEVIRIEPDYGDGLMHIAAFINGMGTTYLASHHNTKNIILGLKNEEDKKIAYRLLEHVDVLVENRRVGAMDRLGFGYEDVSKINPRIIYASSAAYGHSGPFLKYGGADHFIQAMSGFASLSGQQDGPAEWMRYLALVDLIGSTAIVQGCLVGLVEREKTGRGQYIDLDEFSSSLFAQSTRIAEYFATGEEPRRMGSESGKVCPSKAYLTQDGKYLLISAFSREHWVNLCRALEMTEFVDDERFSTNDARLERRDEVNGIIGERIGDKPMVWWLWQLDRYKVPHSKVMGVEDLVQDPDIVGSKYILDLPSAWGTLKYPNTPWQFQVSPLNEVTSCPYVNEDKDYVLSLLKGKPTRQYQMKDVSSSLPLEGMRVVDLTQGIAGPLCTAQLGSLGAEVVKVEKGSGDFAREWGPEVKGESAIFMQLNHDKKSVLIDYGSAEGLDALRELAKTADVFVEDFNPGEAERLGFGYDDLCRLNKDIIYCSIYPFGDKGSFLEREGTELEIQGMSGFMKWLGEMGKEPVRIGADVFSSLTGMFVFNAIMAAIYNHKKRHLGEKIITSRLSVALCPGVHGIMPMSGVDYWGGFWVTGPYDKAETGYMTKNRPIMLGIMTKGEEQGRATLEELCRKIGLEEKLKDPEFVKVCSLTLGTGRDMQEIKPVFEATFKDWDADELVAVIDKCGGLAAPLVSYRDLFEPLHEQVKANNMVVEQKHPRAGKIRLVSNPWRHADGAAEIRSPAPALGEHTYEILSALG